MPSVQTELETLSGHRRHRPKCRTCQPAASSGLAGSVDGFLRLTQSAAANDRQPWGHCRCADGLSLEAAPPV